MYLVLYKTNGIVQQVTILLHLWHNIVERSVRSGCVNFLLSSFLGSYDRELNQRKKEQYRQDLMEQIAEQQRNKKR